MYESFYEKLSYAIYNLIYDFNLFIPEIVKLVSIIFIYYDVLFTHL